MTFPPHHAARAGFSRIELLVTVGILGLLAAMIIPAMSSAREAARRTQCKNNLHQLGLGLMCYHDGTGSFPQGCIGNLNLPPEKRWSWYPWIGNCLQHYGTPLADLDRAWDDSTVQPLRMQTWSNGPLRIYETDLYPLHGITCPSSMPEIHSIGQPFADYVGIGGVGSDGPNLPRRHPRAGMWAYETVTSLEDCTDGIANTLMVVETNANRGCWIAGGPATVRPVDSGSDLPIGKGRSFGSFHADGTMALFADGHVVFLSDAIDSTLFQQSATLAGGDDVEALEGGPLPPVTVPEHVEPMTMEEHIHTHE